LKPTPWPGDGFETLPLPQGMGLRPSPWGRGRDFRGRGRDFKTHPLARGWVSNPPPAPGGRFRGRDFRGRGRDFGRYPTQGKSSPSRVGSPLKNVYRPVPCNSRPADQQARGPADQGTRGPQVAPATPKCAQGTLADIYIYMHELPIKHPCGLYTPVHNARCTPLPSGPSRRRILS